MRLWRIKDPDKLASGQGKDGAEDQEEALILEGKEEKDFGWASALYTESGPAPLRLPLKLRM